MTSTTTSPAAGAFPWWPMALGVATLLCCIAGLVVLLMVKPGSKKRAAQTREARLTNIQQRSLNPPATLTASQPSAPLLMEPVPMIPAMPALTSPVYTWPSLQGAPLQPVISLNRSAPLLIGPVPMTPSMPAPTSPVYTGPSPRGAPMQPVMMQTLPMASHAQPQLGSDNRARQATATQPFQPYGGFPRV